MKAVTNIGFVHTPSLRGLFYGTNGVFDSVQKLCTERRHTPLIKLRRLDEFHLGIGVVNQILPMALRAACMTSSCERPVMLPEVIS